MRHVAAGLVAALLCACGGARPSPAEPPRPAVEPRAPGAALPVTHHDVVLDDYRFRSGESLPKLRIHYTTLGRPTRAADGRIDNAVLLLHWTSAGGAALQSPEFASSLYGPGQPLDASKHYLIFIDNVGHGGSTKPSDGLHARFPRYGYRDMVDLQHRVVTQTLGVARLRAIVGLSMGGMHAWLWAEDHPEAVGAIMPIVALPTRISGRNLLWRRIVARSIRTDPAWNGGDYTTPPRGWVEAFPMFRMMLDGVPHLHETLPDRAAADAFIEQAMAQARTQDANDVLYSLESFADYDPEAALGKVQARVYALNFSDDEFNPVSLGTLEKLMPKVPRGRFVVQPGTAQSFGHFTQAHPSLWAKHVGTFMHELEAP